jgi:hypothetical protein
MPLNMIIPVGTGASVGTGVTTYSGLLSTVGDWLNRSDLTTKIPDFITLLEARLNRLLRVPEMEEVATLTTDAERLDLPTDFLQARSLYLDSDPRQELEAVSLGTLRTKYAQQISGKPEVYAIQGAELVLGPSPDDEYDLSLSYYQKLTGLSGDNETNWLIVTHPDIYLYGTLTMAEAFLWNDERLPQWKAALDEALDELMEQGKRKQYGAAPLRLRASVRE